ncbi:peroxisome membrane protein [Lipomyces arxii]|uniref:peroxisome membrane protein n=1 Tax=Lipomyces arxii TaxID=56418 RepID=UPI0034CE68A9
MSSESSHSENLNSEHSQSSHSSQSSVPEKRPKSWLSMYESFLLKNASQISSVESTLNQLTYVFPGRFKDAEIASEVLYSALSILGLYHDTLISRAAAGNDKYRPSLHSNYTNHYMQDLTYKRIAYFLTIIQKTELLLEIVARKRGGVNHQHATVLGLESVKAACRLTLMRITRSRTVVTPSIPQREVDPKLLDPNDPATIADQIAAQELYWTMPRTGHKLPVMQPSKAGSSYLLDSILLPDDVAAPQNLVRKLNQSGQAKETLYVLRPLIYAVLTYLVLRIRQTWNLQNRTRLQRATDWMPWVVGFALEYATRDGAMDGLAPDGRARAAFLKLTGLEKEELNRRKSAMWWWTLRGQFYTAFTKPMLTKIVQKTEHVPILNLIGLYVADYQYLLETYHFATSTL